MLYTPIKDFNRNQKILGLCLFEDLFGRKSHILITYSELKAQILGQNDNISNAQGETEPKFASTEKAHQHLDFEGGPDLSELIAGGWNWERTLDKKYKQD